MCDLNYDDELGHQTLKRRKIDQYTEVPLTFTEE